MEIKTNVIFGDEKVKKAYEELDGDFQEKQLKRKIDEKIDELKRNAFSGIQISKRLIPKEYTKRFGELSNLWKHNLPNGWRLIYTVKNNGVTILSIVLEWMSHPEYERRFGYG
ncbi:MAG TPA: type II toxin-antitoxin system RelE/ParE family toxin [Candidatus Nanoarchaeia archaeon]|nr:type II toxin-antitoxin system RelE/ParE family toxin [Candidatus Nanoarchaeia archaeon]